MAAPNESNSIQAAANKDLLKTLAEIWKCGKQIPFPGSYDESGTANGKLRDSLLELKKYDHLFNDEEFSANAAEIRDMIGTVVFYDLKRGFAEERPQIVNSGNFFEDTIQEIVLKALPPPGPEGRILLSFNLIQKIPKFAELLPKFVSWKCKGIRAPYPPVYPSAFSFHNDIRYLSCKNPQYFKFHLMKENLVHQTDSDRFQRMLVVLVSSESEFLEIVPHPVNLDEREHGDSYPDGLVYFGVKHPDSLEQQLNSDEDPDSKKYSKSFLYMKQCRYGPCKIISYAENVFKTNNLTRAFNRGTKSYPKEYSQQIFASSDKDTLYTLNVDTSKVHNLDEVKDLHNFEWEFKYCEDGSWTNLEVVVLGGVKCKLGEFKIQFSEEHQCINRICCNCRKEVFLVKTPTENASEGPSPSKISKFDERILVRNTPSQNKSRVIKIFALTVPKELREKIKSLQENYQIFCEDDFKEIMEFWVNYPETYTLSET